jgi:hypothetical protein
VARTTYEPRRAYFSSLCMRIRGKLFAGDDLRTQSGGAPQRASGSARQRIAPR